MNTFAFLVVHRLYHPWSCDQYYLGQLVFALLAFTIGSAGKITSKPSNATDSNSSIRILQSAVSSNQVDITGFLSHMLQELSVRYDFLAFFHLLCEDLHFDTALGVDSDIANLCFRVVEPICAKLEVVLLSGSIPAGLRYTLLALQQGSQGSDSLSHFNIKKFLAQCINTHIANLLSAFNKHTMETGSTALSEYNCNLMINRVQYLFNLCFDQDVGKKLQLCLSDTAALARSKWLVTRSVINP
jgi:hypothetical protein